MRQLIEGQGSEDVQRLVIEAHVSGQLVHNMKRPLVFRAVRLILRSGLDLLTDGIREASPPYQ